MVAIVFPARAVCKDDRRPAGIEDQMRPLTLTQLEGAAVLELHCAVEGVEWGERPRFAI